jgi:hypothetical protein
LAPLLTLLEWEHYAFKFERIELWASTATVHPWAIWCWSISSFSTSASASASTLSTSSVSHLHHSLLSGISQTVEMSCSLSHLIDQLSPPWVVADAVSSVSNLTFGTDRSLALSLDTLKSGVA